MNEERYRGAEMRLWRSVGSAPSERRLALDRLGVSVRVQEIGEGPVVVFVHGGSNAGTSWAPLVARLDGFHCVVLDRPGCGLSDPLASGFVDVEQFETYADSLIVEVLDALGMDRAHVVATSLGGYFAIRCAGAHPDRISRFVEVGWPAGAPVARMPLIMRLGTIPTLGRLVTSVPPTRRAVRAMLRQIGLRQAMEAGRVSEEMIDWFLAVLRDTDTMRNEIDALPRSGRLTRDMDGLAHSAGLLEQIKTPVRFIWGEEDLFGGTHTAHAFVAHFPDAELDLVAGAGHAPWIDDPAHVADLTTDFLSR